MNTVFTAIVCLSSLAACSYVANCSDVIIVTFLTTMFSGPPVVVTPIVLLLGVPSLWSISVSAFWVGLGTAAATEVVASGVVFSPVLCTIVASCIARATRDKQKNNNAMFLFTLFAWVVRDSKTLA